MAGLQLPNPPPSSPAVRNVMRANRAKDTGPELRLRRALREAGLGGYRLNWKKAPGRPDIAYPGRKRRDLRPRLLLAPLPALLPEPPEVQPRVLGPQVRAQPRARRPRNDGQLEASAGRSRSSGSATSGRLPEAVGRLAGRLQRSTGWPSAMTHCGVRTSPGKLLGASVMILKSTVPSDDRRPKSKLRLHCR